MPVSYRLLRIDSHALMRRATKKTEPTDTETTFKKIQIKTKSTSEQTYGACSRFNFNNQHDAVRVVTCRVLVLFGNTQFQDDTDAKRVTSFGVASLQFLQYFFCPSPDPSPCTLFLLVLITTLSLLLFVIVVIE